MNQAIEAAAQDLPGTPSPPADLCGISVRALVLAVLLTVATFLGITRLGFIRICWVPYVVPPVPALLFLMILQGGNLLLGALHRRGGLPAFLQPLSRGELFLIYAAICVSLSMDRGGYILHYLMLPQYYGTDVNQWQELFQHYPSFYIPHDPLVVKGFFEGAPAGRIPWQAWWLPLAWWMGFHMLVMVAVMCLVAFFRRQWSQAERLTYPMLFLPLEITGGFAGSSVGRGFFRNPIMWIGFGAATLFNAMNIAHAFFPGFPHIRMHPPLGQGMIDEPWRHLRPLRFSYALEVWGLSYLMSGEVLLSAWFFYFFMKLVKVIGRQAGYRGSGFPFYQEVSAGSCIAFTMFMVYVARPHFKRVLRSILGGAGEYDSNEPMTYRALAVGFVGATVGMIWMLSYAGHRTDLLIFYFATLYMFTLVASRIRAEAGPPVLWTHPYGFDTQVPIHLLGTRYIRGVGSAQPMVLYYALFWIGRTVFAHSAAQYFTDGFRLADYGKARRASMARIMLFICLVGLALAYWYHLDVGYRYGQGLIGAKTGRAHRSWGLNWSRGQYRLLDQALEKPRGPDWTRIPFYAGGFVLTALLTWARTTVPNFPFHPLGVIMGTLYGDGSPYWSSFLIAWIAQRITLRYGSLPAYRKVVPAFLGLFLGHALVGGVLWRIIINYFIDPTISYRYYLNLGG